MKRTPKHDAAVRPLPPGRMTAGWLEASVQTYKDNLQRVNSPIVVRKLTPEVMLDTAEKIHAICMELPSGKITPREFLPHSAFCIKCCFTCLYRPKGTDMCTRWNMHVRATHLCNNWSNKDD